MEWRLRLGSAVARTAMGMFLLVVVAACVEDRPIPTPARSSAYSLLAVDEEFFAAYIGQVGFAADAVLGDGQPEFPFDAVSAPLSELDGREQVVDLEEPSDWVVMHNFMYGADSSTPWFTLRLPAGTAGLSGRVTANGVLGDSPAVTVDYQVEFHGFYELPGFEQVPEVHIGWSTAAPTTPQEVRVVPHVAP